MAACGRRGGDPRRGKARGPTHSRGPVPAHFQALCRRVHGEFFPEEFLATRQELEKAFGDGLDGAREPLGEPYLGFPSFTPRELDQAVKSTSAEVSYLERISKPPLKMFGQTSM